MLLNGADMNWRITKTNITMAKATSNKISTLHLTKVNRLGQTHNHIISMNYAKSKKAGPKGEKGNVTNNCAP